MDVKSFVERHYRHFNAAALADAAAAYVRHLDGGGRMLVALGGAMSTAELGRSLAEMIRRGKVHAICCTGANLEEDVYNLVAHSHYRDVPEWRNLTAEQEKALEAEGLARVTDTCIPENEAFGKIDDLVLELWKRADREGQRRFPHEYVFDLVGSLSSDEFEIDPADSWVLAAAEAGLPLFVPGWEDSTLGNSLVSEVLRGNLSSSRIARSGLEYMEALADWYATTTMGVPTAELPPIDAQAGAAGRTVSPDEAEATVGFFQIGGGIAGDFPICVVPMIQQDVQRRCPYWGYFCQISDSTTSYGSYSGAFPREKITWGKIDVDTPSFLIESDATIVAPLVFGYVLGW